jgi:hypothetical protein
MLEQKFYQKKWFAILMLFFFAPLGIFLIFKHGHFSKKTNMILSGVFGILFLIAFIGGEGEQPTAVEEPKAEVASAEVDQKEKTKAEDKKEVEKPKAKAEAKPKEEKKKEEAPLTSGENGVLNDDVFVGLGEDKTNYDEMFTYITKGNQDALTQMIFDGKVAFAEKSTAITVVDRGFINAKIQIIETGARGWVPVEYLARSIE